MARKNVSKVFDAWVAGKASTGSTNHHGSRTIWTDGKTIYSYAMPIAVRTGPTSAIVSKDSPTVTTSCHLGGVRTLLHLEGFTYELQGRETVKAASQELQQAA